MFSRIFQSNYWDNSWKNFGIGKIHDFTFSRLFNHGFPLITLHLYRTTVLGKNKILFHGLCHYDFKIKSSVFLCGTISNQQSYLKVFNSFSITAAKMYGACENHRTSIKTTVVLRQLYCIIDIMGGDCLVMWWYPQSCPHAQSCPHCGK